MYEVTSLEAIKNESVKAAFENPRIKKEINARIEAIQSKGDWVSFRPNDLVASLERAAVLANKNKQYVSERIADGDYRPMDGKAKRSLQLLLLKRKRANRKSIY